jgi:hypothetical protein
MKIAEVEWSEVTLVPEDVMRDEPPEEVDGVVSVGKPFVVDAIALARASREELDAEITLLAGTHVFPYLRLPLSIRPGDKHDIRFVALDVTLESNGGGAVCWSMEPMRVDQEIKVRTESKLTSKLGLKPVAISGSASESEEYIVYQPRVEAFGIGQANPGWEMRAEGRKLSGVQIFHMVVQVPKAGKPLARVSLRADIWRRGILWPCRARRADQSEEIFAVALL